MHAVTVLVPPGTWLAHKNRLLTPSPRTIHLLGSASRPPPPFSPTRHQRAPRTLNDGTNHQPPHPPRSRHRQSWPLINVPIDSTLHFPLNNRMLRSLRIDLATHADKHKPCHIVDNHLHDQQSCITSVLVISRTLACGPHWLPTLCSLSSS